MNSDGKIQGLSQREVDERVAAGKRNVIQNKSSRTISQILRTNICTFFNLLNVILLVLVITVGSVKNMFFILLAVANTLVGTIQEIRAKRTLDKLRILTISHIPVIRDGVQREIPVDQLVPDDIMILKTGSQIPADAVVIDGSVDVNESLLTGESDSIYKTPGTAVLSGSFVTAGTAVCRVTKVGEESYMEQISKEAKVFKQVHSELRNSMNKILKFISIVILPIGIALFCKQYFLSGEGYNAAILDTVSAMLGMIPQGLVLLISTALALGVIRLSARKTLVQELYCIETLARVDTLCLDKTGTITEGRMCVQGTEPLIEGTDVGGLISRILAALSEENDTSRALQEAFPPKETVPCAHVIPFSSDRKYSGAAFQNEGTYYMGAYQFLFPKADPAITEKIREYAKKGMRVLVVAHTPQVMQENSLPADIELLGLVLITDVIRKEAPEILQYFYNQGVDLKVISGDDPVTVSAIAAKAGLRHAEKYVDATTLHTPEELQQAVRTCNVFGRVTPRQKEQMVRALQNDAHTVAMTGDGVNDVLALKAADCSIAMASGSDAAKNTANLVLLDSNFASMPHIVNEGRRVINNIRMAASMFLVKTIFSMLLSIMTIFFGQNYPFIPIQLSIISACAVGIPTLILQLEPSFEPIEKGFLRHVFRYAIPVALTIGCSVFLIDNIGALAQQNESMISTVCVLVTGWNYLYALRLVYSPLTKFRKIICYCAEGAFLLAILIAGKWLLELSDLTLPCVLIVMFAMNFAPPLIGWLVTIYNRLCDRVLLWMQEREQKRREKKGNGAKPA
ncbi:MAG: HAD-IC family P-type ATPase [Candidatus Heritagella sp.]